MQQYKGKKYNINASTFYHEDYQWKVILPTIIVNYLKEKVREQPPFEGFKMDNALYFLSLIISIPAYKKDKTYLWGFVPMDSKRLRNKSHLYKKYFEYFVNIGIVESKNYSRGKICKRYRYNLANVVNKDTECLGFSIFKITDNFLVKNLLKESAFSDVFISCSHLCKWFNKGLRLDFDRVKHDFKLDFQLDKSMDYSRLNLSITKTYSYWYSAAMLKEQCFRVSRQADSDNRLHTNLTNMPSKFRPYLTYDGENIQSMDIKNSQPYFMVLVLESLNKKKKKNYRDYEESV